MDQGKVRYLRRLAVALRTLECLFAAPRFGRERALVIIVIHALPLGLLGRNARDHVDRNCTEKGQRTERKQLLVALARTPLATWPKWLRMNHRLTWTMRATASDYGRPNERLQATTAAKT